MAVAVACSQVANPPVKNPSDQPTATQATSVPTTAPNATTQAADTPSPQQTDTPKQVDTLSNPLPSPTVPTRTAPAATAQVPPPSPTTASTGAVPRTDPVTYPEPPDRDLFELAIRLRDGVSSDVPRTVNPNPISYHEGHTETFSVTDLIDRNNYEVTATIRLVSDHAYWYVDDSLNLSVADLRKASIAFEDQIRPRLVESFGDIWTPGVDNDPHLVILHTPLRAAAGYFGSGDEFPRATHPDSNEHEMIYMAGRNMKPGSDTYLAVLAHEFQHAIHWNLDGGEDSWINEGMSEVAAELAGYRASFINTYLAKPTTQLNFWPDAPGASRPNYGGSALFLMYLGEHYGGFERLSELASDPADGVNGVQRYLSNFDTTFEQVFKDWVIANYLDESEGLYGYSKRDVAISAIETMDDNGGSSGSIPQFSAKYIRLALDDGSTRIDFKGDTSVSQFGAQCHSGSGCWWGNRGDSIDSMLTGTFDLTGQTEATLEFWTWYDIEEDWDYAYVEASGDGGKTWTILEALNTTTDNPVGNSYGAGFTGAQSDWVQERIDLSPFAGGEVMLRFEYITDDAVYRDGFVIDDISVSQIGFFDNAESDDDWDAKGFERVDNVLDQRYFVQVIENFDDGSTKVRDLELNALNEGSIVVDGFGSNLKDAVVVISPVTLNTHQQAGYSLTARRVN